MDEKEAIQLALDLLETRITEGYSNFRFIKSILVEKSKWINVVPKNLAPSDKFILKFEGMDKKGHAVGFRVDVDINSKKATFPMLLD